MFGAAAPRGRPGSPHAPPFFLSSVEPARGREVSKHRKSPHRDAAKRHARAAREHDAAARAWLERGDSVRTGFEQRAAKLERELAHLERDHAEHEARKPTRAAARAALGARA